MKRTRLLPLLALAAVALALPSHAMALDASPFDFRVPIAVSGYAGAAPLTNFPVLVTLSADSPSGFRYSDCAADGSDLRFADADGNLLPHEVDTWNAAGESLVWVGLPVLTNGATFTMYFGSAQPGPASAQNLWSLAGYAGVWHLTDGHDSSTNGLDGTLVAGIAAAADSKLGGALDFADAKMSVGTTPNGDLASGFSLEAWCHPRRLTDTNGDSSKNGNAFFGKNAALSVRVQGTTIRLTTPSVKDHDLADCAIAVGQWFHLGITFLPNPAASGTGTVANQYKVYRDGVQKASLGASRIPNLSSSSEMWIGGNQWDTQVFDGILDEFRLSCSIRSADWIKAAFDTAAAPVSFLALGPVEQTDPTAPTIGTVDVASTIGSFVVTAVVSKNVPASIVCSVDGTDYAMTTTDAAPPATYSAAVSGLAAGTHTATVRATSANGTVVSVPCPVAFHAGPLSVTVLSDADEGTLSPGVFHVSRADADPTGLPALTFDVAFSGDGLAAVVAPGVSSLTIPAGAASVDIAVQPVYAPAVDADATLTLTVSGPTVGAPSSGSITIVNQSYDPCVRYVATDGDDANHGGTPDLPKATIAAAVASLDGVAQSQVCTIHVAPGIYTLVHETDNPIVVTNAIRIVGDGAAPESVIVRRTKRASANSSAFRSYQDCSFFHLDHPDALVANLVLDYGSAHQPGNNKTAGSAWIGANGGTISNCVVRGGRASHPYAVTPGILVLGPGLVTHCVITNNVGTSAMESSWAGTMLGNAVVLKGAGSRLENCLVRDNRSESEGGTGPDRTSTVCAEGTATIANCTIVGNRARNCGGVFANGTGVTVRNCVIAGNTDVGAETDHPNWTGTGTFVACATDDAAPVDETCIAGSLGAFFPHLADDVPLWVKFRPASGGLLYDKGADYAPMAAFDLSGRRPRRIGKRVDIGCYEASAALTVLIVR